MPELEYIEINTHPHPDACVIWLHGLGADGRDFSSIIPELALPDNAKIRFIFPHAPMQAVTLNGGMAMRAWFDIYALDCDAPADRAGIARSQKQVMQLVESEKQRGITSGRIILAGFSQGGAVALITALRQPQDFAGVLALSTYLPLVEAWPEATQSDLAVMQMHGSSDELITLAMAEATRAELEKRIPDYQWRCYDMAHSVCFEELQDIGKWLARVLSI